MQTQGGECGVLLFHQSFHFSACFPSCRPGTSSHNILDIFSFPLLKPLGDLQILLPFARAGHLFTNKLPSSADA